MKSPSQALALAKGLQGALKTLSLVSEELEKGDSGNAGSVGIFVCGRA